MCGELNDMIILNIALENNSHPDGRRVKFVTATSKLRDKAVSQAIWAVMLHMITYIH